MLAKDISSPINGDGRETRQTNMKILSRRSKCQTTDDEAKEAVHQTDRENSCELVTENFPILKISDQYIFLARID